MSNRPFIAARVEEFFDRRFEAIFRGLGWQEKVISYTGYGTAGSIRVLGRVVLVPRWSSSQLGRATEEFVKRRGFRNFFTAACVRAKVTIEVGGREHRVSTDRGGYIDHRIRRHDLAPGWQTIALRTDTSEPAVERIHVVADDTTFGIISDVDDTVISTWLPRPMIAAWNSFIRDESARQAVPGMARMYHELLAEHPGAPLVYLSTGAWNTHGFLNRFLTRHNFPPGPMLLTDWGPTNTGWFRSGMAHKKDSLLLLTRDFPNVSWVLVGDDGQHDPEIYGEFARLAPERVRAIAIRQLTPTEQVLAHGTMTSLAEGEDLESDTPTVAAPDGRRLRVLLRAVLDQN